jgi:putative MATE family efflux protein
MKDFTQGPIIRQVIGFSIPMLIANFLQSAYNVVDAIFVGRILGTNALAAVTATMPLVMLLVSVLIGLAMATSVLTAQAFGLKDMVLVKKMMTNSFVASLILCLLIAVAGIVFATPLLRLVNTPSEVIEGARTFFVIILAGLVFQFIYNWFSGILRGLGDAKTPLYLMIVSTALNVLFVPLLIIGPGPIPALGIAGAAVGTVAANFISVIVGYIVISRRNPLFDVRRWEYVIDWSIIGKIFTIGIPASLQMIVTSLSAAVIVALVNRFGPIITAAYGIGAQADQLAFLPSMTISIAISSMAAQNLAAGKHDRAQKILWVSAALSMAIAVVSFCVMFFAPRIIASLFTKDKAVIDHAAAYFHIVSFTYLTFALLFSFQGIVRASGDTMAMLIITVISIVIFRVPLAWALSTFTALHEKGIWAAMVASTVVGLALNYWYYASGRWRRLRIVAPAPDVAIE